MNPGQLIGSAFFAAWFAWTMIVVFSQPWMIETHMPIQASGEAAVNTSRVSARVLDAVRYPRWDAVKTYSVVFFADTMEELGSGIGKNVSMYVKVCKPVFTLACYESSNKEPLLYANYGTMEKPWIHYHRAKNVPTPEPRGSAFRGRDLGNPSCNLDLITRPEKSADCKDSPPLQFRLRWDLRITPHWHWTDWFPREIAEGVFLVLDGFVSLIGGPTLTKW
jgi:hypothetical protein